MQEDRFAGPVDHRRTEHAEKHRALHAVVSQHEDHQKADKHGHNGKYHINIARAHAVSCHTRCQRAEKVTHCIERAAVFRVNTCIGTDTDI